MTDGEDVPGDGPGPDRPAAEEPAAETRAQRRLRLARVFGDVLPEQTSDDRPDGSPESGNDGKDAWLRAQVPPHHG